MSDNRYPPEPPVKGYLDNDTDDTMNECVQELARNVIGRRIVKVEQGQAEFPRWDNWNKKSALFITLDDGTRVQMVDTDDCCAYTELEAFLLHPELVDHAILGVGTTDDYTRWHIYADLGDVLELTVGWSEGNPFWYGYGFDIYVQEVEQ